MNISVGISLGKTRISFVNDGAVIALCGVDRAEKVIHEKTGMSSFNLFNGDCFMGSFTLDGCRVDEFKALLQNVAVPVEVRAMELKGIC